MHRKPKHHKPRNYPWLTLTELTTRQLGTKDQLQSSPSNKRKHTYDRWTCHAKPYVTNSKNATMLALYFELGPQPAAYRSSYSRASTQKQSEAALWSSALTGMHKTNWNTQENTGIRYSVYCPALPFILVNSRVFPRIPVYSRMLLCISVYYRLFLFIPACSSVFSCNLMYSNVFPCVAVWSHGFPGNTLEYTWHGNTFERTETHGKRQAHSERHRNTQEQT